MASGDERVAREYPFSVDMAGILEILSRSLYSRRDVAIRELLQNAHDAVVRRRAVDLAYLGAIRLAQDPAANAISVSDDGAGIGWEEAERYLGTLGAGVSGALKRERRGPDGRDATGIIGQFGVGLFAGFLLADRIVVESRPRADEPAIRWEAGTGTAVRLGPGAREAVGTTVTLELRAEHAVWSRERAPLVEAVTRWADFLPVPIYLGESRRRLNLMTPAWADPTPDPETVSLELEHRFDDTPLDVIPLRLERPLALQGALYVTRARTPGFSGRPTVAATVRRMVVTERLDGLLPEWGPFFRGILELPDLQPTTSREDLIRDERFDLARAEVERLLLARLRELARADLVKLQAILTWHRYTVAGAALDHPPLRDVLRGAYPFTTTQGALTFAEVLARSRAAQRIPGAGEATIWYHTARAQTQWVRGVFAGHDAPCVEAVRSFEATLLAQLAADAGEGCTVQLASPANERFVQAVLGVSELSEVGPAWREFFAVLGARVRAGSFPSELPVVAFPSRRSEVKRELEALKRRGTVPAAFSRMLDLHFAEEEDEARAEVLLNTRHRLVARALAASIRSPLASVLRVLVQGALAAAGVVAEGAGEEQTLLADLDWIAEALPGAPPEEDP